jgi:hypothetical protein
VARLRIVEVRVERQFGHVAVAVSLGHDGAMATGQVARPAGDDDAPRIAAEAALEALRQLAPARTRWALKDAAVSRVPAGRAVIVHVTVETEDREEHLVGSALGPTPPLEETAARAVVDAVDRRLGWLIRT